MSIFSNPFATTPAQPAQPDQPAQVAPGNIPPQPTVTTVDGSGGQVPTVPEGSPAPVATPEVPTAELPLAQFSSLWDTKPIKEGEDAPAPLSLEEVQAAMNNASFTDVVTPEQLAALQEGGEAAAKANLDMMQAVARNIMTKSTMVSNKLTQDAVDKALAAQAAKIPDMIRSQDSANHLKTTNPIFSNPAVKPVIDATRERLLQQYPNATNQEITTMTQDYIVAMGEAFAPPKPDLNAPSKDMDFSDFLS